MLIANTLYIVANYKTSVVPPLISQIFTSFMFFLHCFPFPQNRVLSVSKEYRIRLERGQCHTPLLSVILFLRRLSKDTEIKSLTKNRKEKHNGKNLWSKHQNQR